MVLIFAMKSLNNPRIEIIKNLTVDRLVIALLILSMIFLFIPSLELLYVFILPTTGRYDTFFWEITKDSGTGKIISLYIKNPILFFANFIAFTFFVIGYSYYKNTIVFEKIKTSKSIFIRNTHIIHIIFILNGFLIPFVIGCYSVIPIGGTIANWTYGRFKHLIVFLFSQLILLELYLFLVNKTHQKEKKDQIFYSILIFFVVLILTISVWIGIVIIDLTISY